MVHISCLAFGQLFTLHPLALLMIFFRSLLHNDVGEEQQCSPRMFLWQNSGPSFPLSRQHAGLNRRPAYLAWTVHLSENLRCGIGCPKE